MLFAAFVVGGVAGWLVTHDTVGMALGATVAAVIDFLAERWARTARSPQEPPDEPVDLSGPDPESLTANAYAAMPLPARNGTVARIVASASGVDLDAAVALLSNLMWRRKAADPDDEQTRQAIMKADKEIPAELREQMKTVCEGELRLAARTSRPETDRAREFAEESLGEPLTDSALRRAALKARLGTGQTVSEMIDDTLAGGTDLAFAVATIRRVGEIQAAEFAKIR